VIPKREHAAECYDDVTTPFSTLELSRTPETQTALSRARDGAQALSPARTNVMNPFTVADVMLTAIISEISDSSRLLPSGDSNCA